MVKYFLTNFLTADKDRKWHGRIIDDSEGTIGHSRQITRFREKVEPAILQLVTENDKFLFVDMDSGVDTRAEKLRKELNEILSKNHFETSIICPKIDPVTLTTLGIEFEFESTEE